MTANTDLLLHDLFHAYYCARKKKRNTINQLRFELKLEENLYALYDEIKNRRYAISPSIAFIVFEPVQREVFAADFRDRVVHHLLVNYLEPFYEGRLIPDCCSCRKGKGTLYGVERVKRFLRACSDNYTRDAYILKLDIRGYFMSINRTLLYEKVCGFIDKAESKAVRQGKTLPFDIDLACYLTRLIIFNDPRTNCIIKGARSYWDGLPPSKTLFHSPDNCGLPIGNFTSQVFSNIYLHEMDCFVRYKLGMKHYIRYVDDFIVIHQDKQRLLAMIGELRAFIKTRMGLDIHPNKIYLQHYTRGVQFLNAYIKPYRAYVRQRTKVKALGIIRQWNTWFKKLARGTTPPPAEQLVDFRNQINSYLGLMIHQDTYTLRRKILLEKLSGDAFRYCTAINWSKIVIRSGADGEILAGNSSAVPYNVSKSAKKLPEVERLVSKLANLLAFMSFCHKILNGITFAKYNIERHRKPFFEVREDMRQASPLKNGE